MIIPAKACRWPETIAEGAIPALHDHGIKAVVGGIESPDLEINQVRLNVASDRVAIPAVIELQITSQFLISIG
jgi:hypothetical protein